MDRVSNGSPARKTIAALAGSWLILGVFVVVGAAMEIVTRTGAREPVSLLVPASQLVVGLGAVVGGLGLMAGHRWARRVLLAVNVVSTAYLVWLVVGGCLWAMRVGRDDDAVLALGLAGYVPHMIWLTLMIASLVILLRHRGGGMKNRVTM